MNTNADNRATDRLFLIGVRVSFMTLKERSHAAVEITNVLTALTSGTRFPGIEAEGCAKSRYSRKAIPVFLGSKFNWVHNCCTSTSP